VSATLLAGKQTGTNFFAYGSLAAAGVVVAVVAIDSPAQCTYGPIATIQDIRNVEARVTELEADAAYPGRTTNAAFVFVKPAAVTPATLDLVEKKFRSFNIKITGKGSIDAKTIDKDQLIDTHYGAIAHKAMNLKPDELNVPEKAQAEFQATVRT
jgi:hypothetical protein